MPSCWASCLPIRRPPLPYSRLMEITYGFMGAPPRVFRRRGPGPRGSKFIIPYPPADDNENQMKIVLWSGRVGGSAQREREISAITPKFQEISPFPLPPGEKGGIILTEWNWKRFRNRGEEGRHDHQGHRPAGGLRGGHRLPGAQRAADVSPRTRERVLAVVAEHDFRPNSNAPAAEAACRHRGARPGTGHPEYALRRSGRAGPGPPPGPRPPGCPVLSGRGRRRGGVRRPAVPGAPAGGHPLPGGGRPGPFRGPLPPSPPPACCSHGSARELGFDNLSSLTTDDEAAAFQAASYLLDRGHRAIGVLGGSAP